MYFQCLMQVELEDLKSRHGHFTWEHGLLLPPSIGLK
jgi:hypothetical protein